MRIGVLKMFIGRNSNGGIREHQKYVLFLSFVFCAWFCGEGTTVCAVVAVYWREQKDSITGWCGRAVQYCVSD